LTDSYISKYEFKTFLKPTAFTFQTQFERDFPTQQSPYNNG